LNTQKRERPTPEEAGQAVGIATDLLETQDNLLPKSRSVKEGRGTL
jgi:hypothetical protein